MKNLFTVLTVLMLMTSQSFAAACLLSCQNSIPEVAVNVSPNHQDCHDSDNKKSDTSDSQNNCNQSICKGLSQHVEIKVKSETPSSAGKTILFTQTTGLLPQVIALSTFPNFGDTPLPQKIRLHLRLQKLLN